MARSRPIVASTIAVLILATFTRFHLLEVQSFWNDEGNSARLSERSVPAILEGTASDIHPPLYYLALRGWRELIGETEFGLRSFSALAGVVTVAGVLAFSRLVTGLGAVSSGRVVSATAGLLASVSPVMVYYSQETRMYALLALISVLSTLALLKWFAASRGDRRSSSSARWAAAYVFLTAAGLYTHYFFPAILAGQALVSALWWRFLRTASSAPAENGEALRASRQFGMWLGLVAAAALIYLPWAPIFLRQIGGRAGVPGDLTAFAADSARWLVLGSTVAPGEALWANIAAGLLMLMGVVFGRKRAILPVVLAAVPLTLMFLSGATDPAFFKFLLAVVPFLMVLMGLGWEARGPWKGVAAILTVAVVAGSLVSLSNMYSDPAFARADYRAMAGRIASDAPPDAGIILNAPNQWEAFTYYYRGDASVYPLPRGRADEAILEPELEAIAAAHDRLYVLYWGDGQRDPEQIIEHWLDGHTYKASEEWVGDVRFAIYSVPDAERSIPMTMAGAEFAGLDGEAITLREFGYWPRDALSGEIVQVRLLWSADERPSRPYKVFLHLLDNSGQPVAQRDSEPVGGFRPTVTWQPDEVIEDNYGLALPADLTAGTYELRLGLYDAFDPARRLAVGDQDGLTLGSVIVAQPE